MRKNPPAKWVLPAIVDPADRLCFVIQVPNELQHIAAFRGALADLCSAYKWQDDTAHTAKDVAKVWRDVVDNVVECPMSVESIRLNPANDCEIQVSYDGSTYVDAVNLALCATDTANTLIANNQTILNNEGRTGGVYGTAPTITVTPSDAVRCAVATECALYLQQKFTATVTLAKAGFEAAKTVADVAGDLIEAVPVLGALIKAVLDFATEVDTANFDDLLAFNADPDQQHDWVFCKLFCRLGTDGILTQAIYDGWKADLEAEPPQGALLTIIGQCQGLLIAALGFNTFQARGFLHSTDSGEACDPCTDCVVFTITYPFGTGPSTCAVGDTITMHSVDVSGVDELIEIRTTENATWEVVSHVGYTPGGTGTANNFFYWNGTGYFGAQFALPTGVFDSSLGWQANSSNVWTLQIKLVSLP